MTVQEQYDLWRTRAIDDPDLTAELTAIEQDADAISDRFYRDLKFGTGGLRGVLGAGTNRLNIYTVRRATQGLADYLNASGLPKKVALAHDSRRKGALFCREAARVLAANGITAYLYPRLEPTPALSWAVRYLGCGAGVCITASHNPAKYNGYKVYGADGCQITLAVADKVLTAIGQHDYFDSPKLVDYDEAVAAGLIQTIEDKCLSDFVDAVLALRPGNDVSKLKLVYTPLNGSGLEPVKLLLERMGVQNVTVVPEQEHPDGDFPTCPYPNPEIREAMETGLRLCDTVRPDLMLGTDPDCDRMGAAVPDGKGGYRLISGDEMGVLLLDYICRTRLAAGTMPEHPVACTTIVSTDMATPIAKKYGVELRRTLTGFKFIGEQIGLLEEKGEKERFIFGFEESYGYLSGAHVRDKDGVNAVMLACEAAAWYANQGMTLLDALNKRVEFLKEVCGDLGLADVECVHARAEEFAADRRESFDLVTSRAVAALPLLCELCLPLVNVGGSFISMKSVDAGAELDSARRAIEVLGGTVDRVVDYDIPGTEIRHRAIVIKKARETPKKYPRAFAKIKKNPL